MKNKEVIGIGDSKPLEVDMSHVELPDIGLTSEELSDRQIKSSRKQFYINAVLTTVTILIGCLALTDSNENSTQYKNLDKQITVLKESKLQQDLLISKTSESLLYLHNQVRILEKQNAQMKEKKTSTPEKK